MRDAVRGYLALASGLTDVAVEGAKATARALVTQGGVEVERALGRLGLATADEVAALNARVRELERTVEETNAVAPKKAAKRAPRKSTAANRSAAAQTRSPQDRAAKRSVPGPGEQG